MPEKVGALRLRKGYSPPSLWTAGANVTQKCPHLLFVFAVWLHKFQNFFYK